MRDAAVSDRADQQYERDARPLHRGSFAAISRLHRGLYAAAWYLLIYRLISVRSDLSVRGRIHVADFLAETAC